MADNSTLPVAGGGTEDFANDDIAGVKHPRVKVQHGADGSATDVSTASPLPVTLANTGGNSTAVNVADGGATLSVDDGGGSLTVDGTVSVSGSVAVTDNSGSLTVDNAGTFAVQAAQSGTWTVQPGNTANTTAWKVDGSAVTQPISSTALTNFGAGEYETVAASQTTQSLGATGGTGDYIAGILVVPATTSPGNVLLRDGSGSDITLFAGGASSVSNLVPFFIPLGMISGSGAWKVTTGSNVSCIGIGNFT